MLGRTLNGRFRILEQIGMGGMGKVYKAIQSPLDRVVALKVLNPNFPVERDPAFKRRFLLEASMTAKLRHPNSVTLIDYGQTDDGIFFIAMELLEGRTLAEVLAQEKTLSWLRVFDIAQQICRSLREAHRLGVVHRDLKPANVMLLNEAGHDVVKVLDFGLVKSFQLGGGQVDPEVTQAGMFLGSPQYMAPEQAKNVADPRSDIYSLGVLLYQMLVGRAPFVGKDYLDIIFMHMKEAPKPPRQVRPDLDIPLEVESVIMRCLEKEPEKRWASMDDLLMGLRDAGGTVGMQGSGVFFRQNFTPSSATPPPFTPLPLARRGTPVQTEAVGDSLQTTAFDITEAPAAERTPTGHKAGAKKKKGAPRAWVPVLAVGLAMLFGFWLVWLARPRSQETVPPVVAETPKAAVAEPPPAAPTAPKAVRFHVSTEPSGARVFVGGHELGETPIVFELAPGEDGTATAEIVFMLDGYPTQSASAGGSGDVVLRERLQKRVFVRVPSPISMARSGHVETPAPTVVPAVLPPVAPPVVVKAPEATETKVAAAAFPPIAVPAAGSPGFQTTNAPPFSEGMSRPVQLSEGVPLRYTREALAARVEGTMLVRCVVTVAGTLEHCRTLKKLPYMEEAVLASLKSRRYKPVELQGKPVAVEYNFVVRLVLPGR